MALMTGEQYIQSIKNIRMQVYMFGKKIEDPTEDPILRPSLNSVRMTYDLAQLPALRFVPPDGAACAGALAVCGCAVGCVAPRVPQAQPVYILRGAEELPAAQQWLLALENA